METSLLADRTAIIDVAVAYSVALDTRTWALQPLFTADAVWEYPGRIDPIHGPAAVIEMMRSNLSALDGTQHLLGNHQVRIDGNLAEHTCYYQAAHVRRDAPGGDLYIGAGSYQDRLCRTPDGWKFTHRTLTSVWSFGNPAVLRG